MLRKIFFFSVLVVAVSAFGLVEWFVFTELGWKAGLLSLGAWSLVVLMTIFYSRTDPELADDIAMDPAFKSFPVNVHHKD